MKNAKTTLYRAALRSSAALSGHLFIGAMAVAGAMTLATPVLAQTAPTDEVAVPPAPTPATTASTAPEDDGVIVVTGSIIRRADLETPSPVTVLSAESLTQRGVNTVAEAIQRLSANNAGTISQGWNTGFNFAAGANAPALRGLTVQATLAVADGLRLAPYPLADDGQRNFVDLNTIPNAVIERIEVLRDGASSTYGADAIAGVINVITKKEIQGLHVNGSAGLSQRGDAGEQRFDVTWGHGDLDEQGFNFYVSGEYQKNNPLWARDRGYPFNSSDLSRICGPSGSCMHNGNWNGITAEDGTFNGLAAIPGITLVRPITTAGGVTGTGRYSYLNPGAGCRSFDTVTIDPSMSATSPLNVCEVDLQQEYIMLQPRTERQGLTSRFTANVGEDHQVYAMVNYYKTKTFASLTPLSFRGQPAPPNNGAAAYEVIAPIYVCADGVGTLNGLNTGCDATNGTLNPNNPFAALGQTAQLSVRSTRPRTDETTARSLRGALGVEGTFLDGWNYSANFTASNVKLTRVQNNYLIPQRIANALARGTFNFFDFEANTEEAWDYIAPENRTISEANLWQVTGTVSKDLFELPGGPLQAAVGASYRDESIDAPSANPAVEGNQYDRYYSINAVGTKGSRNVKSAFFEVNAPIVDMLEVNASGRYDKYSTGQENFSPKIGAKFTPIEQLSFRGTFSKGFRIPSFNESFGLPTTGYVTRRIDCTQPTFAAFCAAHGNNAYATQEFSVGLTQVGNPELDPEKSTSFTAGVIFEPIRNVHLTVDFWRIKVKGLIVGVTDTSEAFEAYYANNGVVDLPGITVRPGISDPAFPGALPQIGFIESSYANAQSQVVSGLDIGATAQLPVTDNVQLISSFEASYLMKYELTDENGTKLRYDGTLSPCNITSCSGAPKWRGSWQNTLDFGRTQLTATVYYTSGYDLASIDYGGIKGDCAWNAENHSSVVTYADGTPVRCKAKATWNVDFTANHRVNDNLTIYANILNVLDIDAPFDPSAAYSTFQYNPAWAGPNIMGRYFRLGAKVDF